MLGEKSYFHKAQCFLISCSTVLRTSSFEGLASTSWHAGFIILLYDSSILKTKQEKYNYKLQGLVISLSTAETWEKRKKKK